MRRIPDAIHSELLNWSAWCWQGAWPHPLPSTKCGSLEANYRAPPDWNPDDPPPGPRIRPNERQAKRVQEVYEDLPSDDHRRVLKAEYPSRRDHDNRTAAAHALGLSVTLYDLLLSYSIARVEDEFKEACHSVRI